MKSSEGLFSVLGLISSLYCFFLYQEQRYDQNDLQCFQNEQEQLYLTLLKYQLQQGLPLLPPYSLSQYFSILIVFLLLVFPSFLSLVFIMKSSIKFTQSFRLIFCQTIQIYRAGQQFIFLKAFLHRQAIPIQFFLYSLSVSQIFFMLLFSLEGSYTLKQGFVSIWHSLICFKVVRHSDVIVYSDPILEQKSQMHRGSQVLNSQEQYFVSITPSSFLFIFIILLKQSKKSLTMTMDCQSLVNDFK